MYITRGIFLDFRLKCHIKYIVLFDELFGYKLSFFMDEL